MVFFGSFFSSLTFTAAVAFGAPQEDLIGSAPPFGHGLLTRLSFTEDDGHLILTVRGKEITLELESLEALTERCGLKSVDQDLLDVVITGCPGNDRWVTIGGVGSWEFSSLTGQFKETILEHGSDIAVPPPLEDVDALLKRFIAGYRKSNGNRKGRKKNKKDKGDKGKKGGDDKDKDSEDEPEEEVPEEETAPETEVPEEETAPQEQEAFVMEVRYYYDNSMLKLHGSHEEAQLRVRELHEHTAVIMKHESIGRRVFIESHETPVFMDWRSNASSFRLSQFVRGLQKQTSCPRDVAFHHLITAKARDGTVGIAYVGTVCHRDCYNSGITEDGWNNKNTAYTSRVMAHEMGHNLGMSHNFDEKHEGRNCKGYMSYGTDQDNATAWSECAHDDWDDNYENFVATFGKQRVQACMVPL